MEKEGKEEKEEKEEKEKKRRKKRKRKSGKEEKRKSGKYNIRMFSGQKCIPEQFQSFLASPDFSPFSSYVSFHD